ASALLNYPKLFEPTPNTDQTVSRPYTLADTLENLSNPDNADVVAGAGSYSLSVTALTAETVGSDIAGLAAAQSAAGAAVLENPVVVGASNKDAVTVTVLFTLSDTIENMCK